MSTIAVTLFLCVACLLIAATVHQKATRLSVTTPVTATVVQAWVERSGRGPHYFAHLIFDRKQDDGASVHCDVPRVATGQPATAGATLTVAPRATTCFEPDVICDTCTPPNEYFAFAMVIAAAVFGLIGLVAIRSAMRELRGKAA